MFFSLIFLLYAVVFPPLLSIRQHLSYDDCLEDKREDCHNCSVLDCAYR